ncbi:MAG: MogA/MoaB family molybdenum cofactor biosynthesis protein [Candidatus Krumholzibacteria bacterium]|nr:MogA/MoaB family molybdenum cofactor biosynthesis protein [Candidatus Krumholzibacteria bacterium]
MKVLVLTISDRAHRGEYEDLSGPAVEKILLEGMEDTIVERAIVSDDEPDIENVLRASGTFDIILTTGGTGLGPRDVTPEATQRACDRIIPGIGEYLRGESLRETKSAVVSRGTAGMIGKTIVVNMPGSVKGASFCAGLLVDILPHALAMARGEGH